MRPFAAKKVSQGKSRGSQILALILTQGKGEAVKMMRCQLEKSTGDLAVTFKMDDMRRSPGCCAPQINKIRELRAAQWLKQGGDNF